MKQNILLVRLVALILLLVFHNFEHMEPSVKQWIGGQVFWSSCHLGEEAREYKGFLCLWKIYSWIIHNYPKTPTPLQTRFLQQLVWITKNCSIMMLLQSCSCLVGVCEIRNYVAVDETERSDLVFNTSSHNCCLKM